MSMINHTHEKTRKIIESGRNHRNPTPYRAHCSCGYVSQGKTREHAEDRLALHQKEAQS